MEAGNTKEDEQANRDCTQMAGATSKFNG